VVAADDGSEAGEAGQQGREARATLAMVVEVAPRVVRELVVHVGRGDADVVQQASDKDPMVRGRREAEAFGNHARDDAYASTVALVDNADQIHRTRNRGHALGEAQFLACARSLC
jgi:hypothetical protein